MNNTEFVWSSQVSLSARWLPLRPRRPLSVPHLPCPSFPVALPREERHRTTRVDLCAACSGFICASSSLPPRRRAASGPTRVTSPAAPWRATRRRRGPCFTASSLKRQRRKEKVPPSEAVVLVHPSATRYVVPETWMEGGRACLVANRWRRGRARGVASD